MIISPDHNAEEWEMGRSRRESRWRIEEQLAAMNDWHIEIERAIWAKREWLRLAVQTGSKPRLASAHPPKRTIPGFFHGVVALTHLIKPHPSTSLHQSSPSAPPSSFVTNFERTHLPACIFFTLLGFGVLSAAAPTGWFLAATVATPDPQKPNPCDIYTGWLAHFGINVRPIRPQFPNYNSLFHHSYLGLATAFYSEQHE